MRRKKNIKTKSKKNTKKYIFFKCWPLSILICSVILSVILYKNNINIECIKNLMVTDIIITLMPLIFTIVTLSLSLPSETIYGQPFSQIRKIRKDRHFEFTEMIGLNIFVFISLTICEICGFVIQVWALDILSVIYCILFCYQEVPILAKSNSIVKKIIKKSGYLDELSKFTNDFDGGTSNGKIASDIIQAILLSDGIVSTYNFFKTKTEEKNIILLDNLLTLQNNFLLKCSENKEYLSSSSIISYKGLDVLQAIEMAFSNLDSCIISNNDFNYIDIVKSTESYYQITRSIFSLHSLMNEIHLNKKFESYMTHLLRSCFVKINWGKSTDVEKMFVYRILNTMNVYTISNNELWFIKSIRDSGFESKLLSVGLDYFYFITIYLYFISKVQHNVSQETKEKINEFIVEECNGINSENSDNIKSIFNHNWNYKNFDEIANLLPSLLLIINSCGEHYIWFEPPKRRSWSSSEGVFDKEFIIKNWLILLLTSSSYWKFDYDILESIFNKLDERDKKFLVSTINKNFIENGKFIIKDQDTEYANFYDAHIYLDKREFEQDFFKKIVNYVQDINKDEINKSILKNMKSEKDYKNYKDKLVSGLNSEAKKFDIYDSKLKIDFSKKYCYSISFMSEGCEEFIEGFTNDYKRAIDRLIYEEAKRNNSFMKELNKENADSIVDSIIKNKYNNCNQGSYIFLDFNVDNNKVEKLKTIKHNPLWLPNYCFWKDKAIKFNLVTNYDETIVRPFTRDEINRKIDEEYSQVDGLYKYSKYQNDNRSIFISREELIDILSKQYFYACIVFSYKLEIDNESIISLYKRKEKE